MLRGNGGDDTLDGGDGVDTAVNAGNHADYRITTVNGLLTLSGADGTDALIKINRWQFADQTIEIDPPGLLLTGDVNGKDWPDAISSLENKCASRSDSARLWLRRNNGCLLQTRPGKNSCPIYFHFLVFDSYEIFHHLKTLRY